MHIDFRTPGAWSSLNDHVAEVLGLDSKAASRVYQGVGHALVEICVGLSKLYPLKKKIYYLKNMNPYFAEALLPLAREGYKILPLDLGVLKTPDEWVAALDREDLFVLYSADEPLLGRAYDLQLFEEKLKDKNIFKVKVSHSQHIYQSDEVMTLATQNKNMATIYSIDYDQAIAVVGERGRVGPLSADQLFYSKPLALDWFKIQHKMDSKKVLSFEQKQVAGAKPIFGITDLRVADRAVIYWPDLDGAAVIDRLAEKLHVPLSSAGSDTRLESTSLSRWGGVRTMDFLLSQGLTPEMIRGLVIIDHDILDTRGEFEKNLIQVRNSILKDQLGG